MNYAHDLVASPPPHFNEEGLDHTLLETQATSGGKSLRIHKWQMLNALKDRRAYASMGRESLLLFVTRFFWA